MRLVLATFALALIVGSLCRGRLSSLGNVKVRWAPLAFIGLGLQFAPLPGHAWPMAMLYLSFALLFVFTVANVRVAGFPLILIGVILNFTVIAANDGMPVTRQALVASGQASTLSYLIEHGGAKHHLAGPGDRLLFLGDVTAVRPIQQAVSLGDIFTYGGVFWLIVAGMRRREDPVADPSDSRKMPVPSLK